MNFKSGSIGLLLIAVSNLVQASGTVDFLEVDNDVVLFSTTATKTLTSPSCVATESNELWSISLASDSGRAIYSLILTSMSTGADLNVESADHCDVAEGIEAAANVSLALSADSEELSETTSVLTYVKVQAGVALFSVSGTKTDSPLDCVVEASTDLWSISLGTHSGRAIYTLLLASLTNQSASLNVTSTGDCLDLDGVESASLVNYAFDTSEVEEPGASYGFYSGDDVKLAAIDSIGTAMSSYLAEIEESGQTSFLINFDVETNPTLYFRYEDCEGLAYVTLGTVNKWNALKYYSVPYFDNGQLYQASDKVRTFDFMSKLTASGCREYIYEDIERHQLIERTDDFCGDGLCTFRLE